MTQDIPGTIMFDGTQAQKGFALNRMCFSFNSAENRAAFVRDEDAYCRKFGLTDEQRAAVRSRSVLAMIEAGGNVYYLAKLAGIFGLNVQDIGAQQTGTSVDAFKAKLAAAGAADVASGVPDRATARACESRHPHTGGQ
jgi:protocatechuate 4,5-dioxygenase alpha chain